MSAADEAAIAGLLAEHTPMHLKAAQGPNGLVWECCNEVVGPYELEGEELETTYRAHLASIIAAHMAAPDELTALRERVAELEEMLDDCKRSAAGFWREIVDLQARLEATERERNSTVPALMDERDALREQLTALRVAVIELATKHGIESDDLYATLGAGDV